MLFKSACYNLMPFTYPFSMHLDASLLISPTCVALLFVWVSQLPEVPDTSSSFPVR